MTGTCQANVSATSIHPSRTLTPFDSFRARRHFGSLDGLRAISIAAVIWHHSAGRDAMDFGLLGRGYYGVHLFFAISGFLITTLLLRERARQGEISLPKFYIRRTLRIFPLFYTVLAIYIALVLIVEGGSPHGQQFLANVKYLATYTSNWFVDLDGGNRVIFYFAWSLATEEQFYLVWPWIERFVKGTRPVWIMLGILALSEFARLGLLDVALPEGTLLHRIAASVAPPICFGVLLAHMLDHPRGFAVAHRILGRRYGSLMAFALASFVVGTDLHAYSLLIGIAMTLIVAGCVVREDHALAPILTSRPFEHVGKISYGMYLFHMLAWHAFVKPFHFSSPLLQFAGQFLATTAVASLSFRYYESWFLKQKERFAA